MLFLDNELYLGFIKLQNDKKLGRSFAGLLSFVEGLHKMGYIEKDTYERHKIRYSKPLVIDKKRTLTKEELEKNLEIEQLDKRLENVITQWNLHPSLDWRNQWTDIARKNPNLTNSKKILALSFNNKEL